jgi:hypothetical protein
MQCIKLFIEPCPFKLFRRIPPWRLTVVVLSNPGARTRWRGNYNSVCRTSTRRVISSDRRYSNDGNKKYFMPPPLAHATSQEDPLPDTTGIFHRKWGIRTRRERRGNHFSDGTGHPILGSFFDTSCYCHDHAYNVIHKNKKQYDSAGTDGRQDVPDAREPGDGGKGGICVV